MPAPALRPALAALFAAALMAGPVCAAVVQLQSQAHLPPSANTPPHAKPASTRVAQAARSESKPGWSELTASQKQALGPLNGTWNTLSEAHKRKWIALSQNFGTLPPAEQARLHSRMGEWAALSPQQRTQARFNFAETQKLPPGDRKAKWEAYQALSPEEKRKLAGAAASKPAAPATAAAAQPVPQQKLTTAPRKPDARTPRIAGLPTEVDHHTLLPQPGAVTVQP